MSQSLVMTGWGQGVPYAGWIVIDLRDSRAAGVHAVVAEHSVECAVDHGDTRHIFARREFLDDAAYQRLLNLGYCDFSLTDFVGYPGAEGVLKVLGLIGRQRCRSTQERWGEIICLRYEHVFMDIKSLIDAEDAAFGRDALKIPEVIGLATGPIPRPDDSMPNAD